MSPFPTVDPSVTLDGWQSYTVAVREWQGDVALLAVFALVVFAGLLLFAVGTLLVPAVVKQ